jgi:hypothetical protein
MSSGPVEVVEVPVPVEVGAEVSVEVGASLVDPEVGGPEVGGVVELVDVPASPAISSPPQVQRPIRRSVRRRGGCGMRGEIVDSGDARGRALKGGFTCAVTSTAARWAADRPAGA